MATVYFVYINTMVFAIVSGVVSLILLLALAYVPSVGEYAILILTVQIALLLIVVIALARIWWFGSQSAARTDLSNRNTLSVGFCPDYMVATANDSSNGGGTTCQNRYAGSKTKIWTGSTDTKDPKDTPDVVKLAPLDGQSISSVCQAANDQKQPPASGLLSSSTANVPWTELRSRCSTVGI